MDSLLLLDKNGKPTKLCDKCLTKVLGSHVGFQTEVRVRIRFKPNKRRKK